MLTFDKRFHKVEMHPEDSIHKSMPRITQQLFIAFVINLFLIGNKCVAAVSWTLYAMLNDFVRNIKVIRLVGKIPHKIFHLVKKS